MSSLIDELRRRNVVRLAATYALAAWILIEAGSVLLPTFGAPQWVFRAYVLVIFAGFVVAPRHAAMAYPTATAATSANGNEARQRPPLRLGFAGL